MRGEKLVRGILGAALEELARAGYAALRIEDVAARAGVNKTTVYRRWPTRADLVRAALLSMSDDRITAPSTGSLRGDLLEIARRMAATSCSPKGQSLMRMILAEGPHAELHLIARSLRQTIEAVPRSVIEAAKARGEIAPDIDAMLIFDVLGAAVQRRLFVDREPVDEGYLCHVVDLILRGALAPDRRGAPAGATDRDRDPPRPAGR